MKRVITQICTLLLLVILAIPVYADKVLSEIEYFYSEDGTLIGKAFNGKRVNFEYDMLGSTLAVNGNPVEMTSFGETADKNAFFTGKPMIDELGYSFLFRNYRSDYGKWQTTDPLGYPDGWNNLAYVNNMTTSCVDFLGADIYHILASHAVGGAGHSAAIVGNDTLGYRIMNHGTSIGIGGSANNWATKYNSLSEALQALNSGRTGDYAFDKIQKWDTTSAQDDIAYQKMLERASHEYSEVTNNCWQVIQAGIYEAMYPLESLYCSSSFVPSLAYLENYLNPMGPESLDFNMVINGMIE